MAIKWGEPAPFELLIWNLAEKFGWTIDYIESLPMSRIYEYLQVQEGKAKAR